MSIKGRRRERRGLLSRIDLDAACADVFPPVDMVEAGALARQNPLNAARRLDCHRVDRHARQPRHAVAIVVRSSCDRHRSRLSAFLACEIRARGGQCSCDRAPRLGARGSQSEALEARRDVCAGLSQPMCRGVEWESRSGSPRRPSLGSPVSGPLGSPSIATLPFSTAVQRRRGCVRGCCRPSCVHGIANGVYPGKCMLLSLEHDLSHQGGRMAGAARACMCVRHQMSILAEGLRPELLVTLAETLKVPAVACSGLPIEPWSVRPSRACRGRGLLRGVATRAGVPTVSRFRRRGQKSTPRRVQRRPLWLDLA